MGMRCLVKNLDTRARIFMLLRLTTGVYENGDYVKPSHKTCIMHNRLRMQLSDVIDDVW